MRYDFSFKHCETCSRETLHVGRRRLSLRRRLIDVLTFEQRRSEISNHVRPSRCACCGTIPNPDGRHPLRLRLNARDG